MVSALPRGRARNGRTDDVREQHRRRALNVERAIAASTCTRESNSNERSDALPSSSTVKI
jgi:hypothetical protein